ncbi:MAG TPA: hypothetical protein VM661_00420 [Candidatus Sulfotelmatobacter sp.]|jgi:hypothetical protein|nr:hypothetical protein [Candidatus Sulfotelmatobacter sp.]
MRIAYALMLCLLPHLALAAETVVEIESPRGVKVRALEEIPNHPTASVILLAGGSGDLEMAADGTIGSDLRNNQLVRTRHLYAQAGLAVLTPDLGPGIAALPRYRASTEHAQDLGALVGHLRGIAAPVVIVGTSRGSLSAANLAGHAQGPERPDAVVLTSAFLSLQSDISAATFAGGSPSPLTMPFLLMGHDADSCPETPAGNIDPFRRWLTASPRVDVEILSGGSGMVGKADRCGSSSPHGYLGLDPKVVEIITGWVAGLPR